MEKTEGTVNQRVGSYLALALDRRLRGGDYETLLCAYLGAKNLGSSVDRMIELHKTLRQILEPNYEGTEPRIHEDERLRPAWLAARAYLAHHCGYGNDQADPLIGLVLEKW